MHGVGRAKLHHTTDSLKDKKERQEIKESKITEEAILEVLKITVFVVFMGAH